MSRTRRAMLRGFVKRMDPDAVTAWLANIAIDDMTDERLEYFAKQLHGSENGYGLTRESLLRNLKLDGLRPRIMEVVRELNEPKDMQSVVIAFHRSSHHNKVVPGSFIEEGLRSLLNLREIALTLDYKLRVHDNAA